MAFFYKHANKKFMKNWCEKLDRWEYDSFPEKIVNNEKSMSFSGKEGTARIAARFCLYKTDTIFISCCPSGLTASLFLLST
jgi:hypothetical protein